MSGRSIFRYLFIFIAIFYIFSTILIGIRIFGSDSWISSHDSLILTQGKLGDISPLSPTHAELIGDTLYARSDLSGALLQYRSIGIPSERIREKISLLEVGSKDREKIKSNDAPTTSSEIAIEKISKSLEENKEKRSEYIRSESSWSDKKIFTPRETEIDW